MVGSSVASIFGSSECEGATVGSGVGSTVCATVGSGVGVGVSVGASVAFAFILSALISSLLASFSGFGGSVLTFDSSGFEGAGFDSSAACRLIRGRCVPKSPAGILSTIFTVYAGGAASAGCKNRGAMKNTNAKIAI